jgi:flagellar biosynthesis protein FliQ
MKTLTWIPIILMIALIVFYLGRWFDMITGYGI